jgi:antitoxin PrlF
MATASKSAPTQRIRAKVTSKGQVTIPVELRKSLGIRAGDHLIFERKGREVHLIGEPKENVFEKWRGIGDFPGMGKGREAIVAYFREMRGHDDLN